MVVPARLRISEAVHQPQIADGMGTGDCGSAIPFCLALYIDFGMSGLSNPLRKGFRATIRVCYTTANLNLRLGFRVNYVQKSFG